ncbi:MAG: hypothetical protein JNM09_05055 [Blastocatellia bacterium]|nr:hypothetical protein [Blastocatellia bacterium]
MMAREGAGVPRFTREGAGFEFKAAQAVGILSKLWRKKFQCDFAFEPRVFGQIHFADPTFAQNRQDLVLLHRAPEQGLRRRDYFRRSDQGISFGKMIRRHRAFHWKGKNCEPERTTGVTQ